MFPNVTARVTGAQIRDRFAPHIRAARHFHTEASQLPLAPVIEAMRIAREAGVRVFFDLDVSPRDFFAAGLGTELELDEALSFADVLKPCKAAARELTGVDDPARMAETLLERGPAMVALTMGAEGCLVATREGVTHCPGFHVNVVDTTGAGDCFNAGFIAGLLDGSTMTEALSRAVASGVRPGESTSSSPDASHERHRAPLTLSFRRNRGTSRWFA